MKSKPIMSIMKKFSTIFKVTLFFVIGFFTFSSCELEEDPTPTNELMQGVWEITSIRDSSGTEIVDSISGWFPSYFSLDDKNSVISTAGPVFMYLVYGNSRFISISKKIDDVFQYADFAVNGDMNFLTNGEWFIDKNKVVDNFTIEMKLRFPTTQSLNDVFSLMNLPLPEIVADALDIIVYHKFKFVSIDINDDNPDQMIWTFDDEVVPTYNTKDQYGDYVSYTGIGTNAYSRCSITFTKRIKGITDLTKEAVENGYGQDIN